MWVPLGRFVLKSFKCVFEVMLRIRVEMAEENHIVVVFKCVFEGERVMNTDFFL